MNLSPLRALGETTQESFSINPCEDRLISTIDRNDLINGVKALSASSDVTRKISHFLVHHSFPVDIRHNAKIFREKLAVWAQKKLSPQV